MHLQPQLAVTPQKLAVIIFASDFKIFMFNLISGLKTIKRGFFFMFRKVFPGRDGGASMKNHLLKVSFAVFQIFSFLFRYMYHLRL